MLERSGAATVDGAEPARVDRPNVSASSGGRPRASISKRTVARCGCFSPRSRSLIARSLSPAFSASSACVSRLRVAVPLQRLSEPCTAVHLDQTSQAAAPPTCLPRTQDWPGVSESTCLELVSVDTRVARRVAGVCRPELNGPRLGSSETRGRIAPMIGNEMRTSRSSSHEQHAADWGVASPDVVECWAYTPDGYVFESCF